MTWVAAVATASALVAAGFAFSLRPVGSVRPVSANNVLDAATRPAGGAVFGVSVSGRGGLALSTREFGHLPIIRTSYSGLPAANVWTTGPDGISKSAVIVSFTAPPSVILAGADNRSLAHFFDTAPAGRPIYYSYYSQPESPVIAHKFTASQYRRAWAHIVAIARKARKADLKPTLILKASDLSASSGLSWKNFLPGRHIISTIAWDAYPAGTLSDHDPRLTPPADFMGQAVAASKSAGLRFGFAGFALATAKGRPTWLKSVANYLMRSGALFGVLSPIPTVKATSLTDHASLVAWREVVARSGTGQPLPLGPPTTTGPTPTPTPSTPHPTSTPSTPVSTPTPPTSAPGHAAAVCGQPILNSPFNYNGAAGPYSSGTAGLPTFGTAGSDFPHDTAGDVLPAQTKDYASYQLQPDTVYYLLPGTHIGTFEADTGDAFVGGRANGTPTVMSGNYLKSESVAIDSNSTNGNQTGVTIEYLTIEKYTPGQNAAAINQETNTGWTIQYNTLTLNVPGAGIFAGADGTIKDNCLTLNGQYGFQSARVNPWGADSLTTGPYNITAEGNEISYNDTCDYEGLLNNSAIGWKNYNPVPAADRNPNCGTVTPDGDQGGFKLWQTDGVTIKNNYIHNNWGPGAWADTNNANTTFTGNTFTNNDGPAIVEEVSYNFSITNNYMADNDWAGGLNNAGFPQPAIYVSESGSDTANGEVPACPEASCSGQGAYPTQSVISGNTLVDNGGSIFLWQNSNRHCDDGFDDACTLVGGAASGPFTEKACGANLPTATINTSTYVGNRTGSPSEDWWDGCQWQTAHVSVTKNVIDFNPANIKFCNKTDWQDCGAGGIFSEYGGPNGSAPGWEVPTQLTFFQHDVWADNTYNGPSTFWAWNQGNGDNPVTWADWTGSVAAGDKCSSAGEHQSGFCTGPFGQDAGSTYTATPVATNPSP